MVGCLFFPLFLIPLCKLSTTHLSVLLGLHICDASFTTQWCRTSVSHQSFCPKSSAPLTLHVATAEGDAVAWTEERTSSPPSDNSVRQARRSLHDTWSSCDSKVETFAQGNCYNKCQHRGSNPAFGFSKDYLLQNHTTSLQELMRSSFTLGEILFIPQCLLTGMASVSVLLVGHCFHILKMRAVGLIAREEYREEGWRQIRLEDKNRSSLIHYLDGPWQGTYPLCASVYSSANRG